MARISTYAIDNNITGQDKVLGSNIDGYVTKNYTFNGIVEWLNATGAVAINGQNNYFFQSMPTDNGREQGTISFDLFGGVGTPFADITTFKLAEDALAGYTLEDWLPILVDSEIIIAQLDNLNNFGIYKVISIQRDLVEITFFNVILEYIEGHGSLELDKFYGMSLRAGASSGSSEFELITTNQTLELNKKYLTDNAIKLNLTLPVDNANETIKVASRLGGWRIIVPVGWEVLIADEVITQDLESTESTDSIELLSLGNNKYKVIELIGNIIYNN